MGRSYRAEGLNSTAKYLTVYVAVDMGVSKRFVSVKVPWGMVAGEYQGIMDGCERIFTERLKADIGQQPLPLEVWE